MDKIVKTLFEKNITALDFTFKKKKDEGGVLLTTNFQQNSSNLSPQELFALETAKRFDADAVYFRYFNDGREAVPQVYIYDNTDESFDSDKKTEIHKKVWSGCHVPAFIIIAKTEVQIFDARESIKEPRKSIVETIKLGSQAARQFSARSFDDGLFWEEKSHEKKFQFSTSAYRDLIDGLKRVYIDFQKTSNLDSHVALKLLVQCLLIKYLEERDEQSDNGYFTKTYFKRNFNCKNFSEVIASGQLLGLLDRLKDDFNGKIFEWHVDEEKKERKAIQQAQIKKLADYLDADNQNSQYVIWRLYSFSHLPVELISSVYEELLTNSKDIVYTPEMIVSTLIDECMPLKTPQKDFKLIDVSCGSGIFLVKAYKRIIQWWRYEKWLETGQLQKPDLATLKHLLTKSIYGIDIQGDAIRLSVFSLALALLDEVDLSPPVWQKLKFPDLGKENILERDFFKFITSNPTNDFDLVIGNPPFNPPPQPNGEKMGNGAYLKKIKAEYGYKSEIKIPDDNLALHFLVQAMRLLKPDALLCLIQPSGPLMYQKDEDFKKSIFSKYNLLQIIDFTRLADVLWGKRNVATAAVFLQNSAPDEETVVHVVANRTAMNLKKIFLDLDHYDFHTVDKNSIILDSYLWKANLLGGGRINDLITRLSNLSTLGDFLLKKRHDKNWVFGDGFIKGKPDSELVPSDFEKKKGGYEKAPYLMNSRCFNPEDFDENGIKKTYILKDVYYQWKRNPELFQGPLLLIKKNVGVKSIPVLYTEDSISFKNEVIGIHAPLSDSSELKRIEHIIQANQTFRFYLSVTSARSGISRSSSTLLQQDILNLPFPENAKQIALSSAEKILQNDVLKYRLGSNESALQSPATKPQIESFSKTFCQTLNSIYQGNGKAFKLFKILDAGKYFALHFEYTHDNLKEDLEITDDLGNYIKECIPTDKNKSKNYHIQRILKVYGKDNIILAKPKNLRYWLQSIALRDADETFADYVKAGF